MEEVIVMCTLNRGSQQNGERSEESKENALGSTLTCGVEFVTYVECDVVVY